MLPSAADNRIDLVDIEPPQPTSIGIKYHPETISTTIDINLWIVIHLPEDTCDRLPVHAQTAAASIFIWDVVFILG